MYFNAISKNKKIKEPKNYRVKPGSYCSDHRQFSLAHRQYILIAQRK